MTSASQSRRWRVLPARGTAIVSTDLHGNYEDFARLRQIFDERIAQDPQTHWVILGDLVHGPSPKVQRQFAELFGFPDESSRIVEETRQLCVAYPERVHFVLGNHDYAHIGGPRTAKFYADEAAHLESQMDDDEVAEMRAFFEEALLAVVTPCGAFLCHGAPGLELDGIEELDDIDLPARTPRQREILRHLVNTYGQPHEDAERFLRSVSRPEAPQRFVIHGHDKDEKGWFVEGGNQLCPTLFGAPRSRKCYVVLDLAASYPSVEALRLGEELRRLY